MRLLFLVLLLPVVAQAQAPLTGSAAPQAVPSGVFTPAPVPEKPSEATSAVDRTAAPERVAPAAETAGSGNAAPLSGVPTAVGGAPGLPMPTLTR